MLTVLFLVLLSAGKENWLELSQRLASAESDKYQFLQQISVSDEGEYQFFYTTDTEYTESMGMYPTKAIHQGISFYMAEHNPLVWSDVQSVQVIRCGKTAVIFKTKSKGDVMYFFNSNNQLITKG